MFQKANEPRKTFADFRKDYDVMQAVRGKTNQKLHAMIFSFLSNENFIKQL